MLAQCILESGRGTSRLARDHHNYAGMKWRPEMAGHATKVRYGAHDGVEDYCKFESPEAFVRGYWVFIGRAVYEGWREFANDPAGYIAFLKSRNYAGDPDYMNKVVRLLPEAERLLGDSAGAGVAETGEPMGSSGGQEPERPSRAEIGERVDDFLDADADPEFITMQAVQHRWRGSRPGGLEGAIIHYDSGRTRPARGGDDPELGARRTLEGAVTSGFAFITVSRTGKIYLPGNMDWQQWGYHAGPSRCPATRREGVSRHYVGFEVNSPGLVYPTADADVFVPWYEAERTPNGAVILDRRGRATVRNSGGELYRRDQVRVIGTARGNIARGAYVPYTKAQMEALAKALLWLKRRYPRTFRLEYVFGHDEVSPGRKVDPGGSLGEAGEAELMMSQFRADLLRRWSGQLGNV
jgi:hypothetical protein